MAGFSAVWQYTAENFAFGGTGRHDIEIAPGIGLPDVSDHQNALGLLHQLKLRHRELVR